MNNNESKLFVLYNFDNEARSKYKIVQIFSDRAPVDWQMIYNVYENHYGLSLQNKDEQLFGVFHTLQDLNQFCELLAESLEFSKVKIVSSLEYNNMIQELGAKNEFLAKLEWTGTTIEGAQKSHGASKFLKKIFRD